MNHLKHNQHAKNNHTNNLCFSKIQTVKSMTNLGAISKNNEHDLGEKIARKRLEQLQTSISLTYSKSIQKFPSNNIFIKFDQNMIKSCNILSYSQSYQNLENLKHIDNTCRSTNFKHIDSTCRSTIKQMSLQDNEIQENLRKKPKFIRCRNNDRKEPVLNVLSGKKNWNDHLTENFQQVCAENVELKKKSMVNEKKIELLQKKVEQVSFSKNIKKIKQLQEKIKEFEIKVSQKDKEIKEANQKISSLEEQNKRLEDLSSEEQIFKRSLSSFDLDDSGIKAELISSTQYIESLTDLEDQLQKTKTDIFNLNQLIEQLRMKNHFQEIRHEENIRRFRDQWDNKYKIIKYRYRNLMQMYRVLKTDRNQQSIQMMKRKTKTEFIDVEKEDLFNLSLSTDRSQIYFS